MSDLIKSRVYMDVDDPEMPLAPLVDDITQGMQIVQEQGGLGLIAFEVHEAPRLNRVLIEMKVECPPEAEVEDHVTHVITTALSHMGTITIGRNDSRDNRVRHLAEGSAEYSYA